MSLPQDVARQQGQRPSLGSFRLLSIRSHITLAGALGFLDASVTLAYMADVNPIAWHAGALAVKLALAVMLWRRMRPLSVAACCFLASISTIVVATFANGAVDGVPYLQALGFLMNGLLTFALLKKEDLKRYLASCSILIVFVALVHIAMSKTGHVQQNWGRYLFFGKNEPNLGGEIEAVGAIAAVMAFGRRDSVIIVGILIVDILLLQARSAALTAMAAIVLKFIFDAEGRLNVPRAIVLADMLLIAGLSLLALNATSGVTGATESVLQLSDTHRGVATGFSGRSELWIFAMELFGNSPFTGYPLGYFDQIGYIGPHNLILYGLAQAGISAVPFFLVLVACLIALARRNLFQFSIMCTVMPLFMFNDRLINLNPYPFMFYMILVVAAGNSVRQRSSPTAKAPGAVSRRASTSPVMTRNSTVD